MCKDSMIHQDSDLRGMSLAAVMSMACMLSGKSNEVIAEEMGWGKSVQSRFFHNRDYWPSLPTLSRFCHVVGNTLVAEWIIADAGVVGAGPERRAEPITPETLIQHTGALFGDVGALAREVRKALEDGQLSTCENRLLLKRLKPAFGTLIDMLVALQASIDEEKS